MEDNRYRFSWQNRSVIWEKEYGSFRVSFNLDNTIEVLKEANVPRKHMCHSFRPKYINEILQSIRELDEDCLRGLCKKGLDIHAFRDPQGRSLFHLIAAECFDAPPANQSKRQGKINLLIYLCVDHDPSAYTDAQGWTPLEWAKAHSKEEAVRAFTEVDGWFPSV
jgi:hypothetical protein